MRLLALLVLAAVAAGCGTGTTTRATPSESTRPEVYPLIVESGETAGWLVARHDEWNLSLTTVANPDWSLASMSVSAANEGWTPDTDWSAAPITPAGQEVMTIALPDLAAREGLDAQGLCQRPILLEMRVRVSRSGASEDAWAQAWNSRFAFAFTCDPAPRYAGCVRGLAEWRAAATSSWPVDGLSMGGVNYKNDDLAALLANPSTTDASVILARSLIVASLDIGAGAQAPAAIEETMAKAGKWVQANGDADGRLPFGTAPSPGDDAVMLASTLDRFATGDFGPEPCR